MRLKDKVILVTGSTTGIGEGMVRVFTREGAKVMIHGRRQDAARALAAKLGENASFCIGSLEDPNVPARLIAETISRFGRMDGLVNNAAAITRGNIGNTDSELFDRTVAVDLKAPFLLIQAALPHFQKQRTGRVLNIGSINAYCGERNMPDDDDAEPRRCTRRRRYPDQSAERWLDSHAQRICVKEERGFTRRLAYPGV
jgi:NAD(P)-dependent dehydrogenase (short-subunit alcohol dehydrogenase family)